MKRAFTLSEVLIGGTLLLAVMGIAYALTILTMRYTLAGQDRVSVHVNNAYSLQRLWLQMHEGPLAGLTDNSARFFLDTRLLPPRWVSKPQ